MCERIKTNSLLHSLVGKRAGSGYLWALDINICKDLRPPRVASIFLESFVVISPSVMPGVLRLASIICQIQ